MGAPQDFGFQYNDATKLTKEDFQHLMKAEPEKYPEHLQIARSLDQWVQTVKKQKASGEVNSLDQQRLESLLVALPEVATAMRQGHFLPGKQHRTPTEAELENAERAADAKLKAAYEEGYNG
ncbi:hypothetical protein [Kocuria sp. CPCC 205263]|uniref:hypothetical protein n=1 Tax=Kocuria sp. CPCC 205263 TaxID=3073555 RepID=UPI0034D50AB4